MADTLAGDKPFAIGECEILLAEDELAIFSKKITDFRRRHRIRGRVASSVRPTGPQSSGEEVEMPVGAVLVQTLYAGIPYHGVTNSASVTLNFPPTVVVATASIATLNYQVNALGEHLFLVATIDSYQTSQGGVMLSVFPVLTSDDVVSITFYLAMTVENVDPNTEGGQDVAQGTFMIQGFD